MQAYICCLRDANVYIQMCACVYNIDEQYHNCMIISTMQLFICIKNKKKN